jgi:hypothetical protein
MFKANLVDVKEKKYDTTAHVDGFTNGNIGKKITYFNGTPTDDFCHAPELQQHTKSMRVKSHLLCT